MNRMSISMIAAGALAAAVLAAPSSATPPCVMGYSGKLTGGAGAPSARPVPITLMFKVYDAGTGGNVLWGRAMPVKLEVDGTFYVELADGNGSKVQGARYGELIDAIASAGSAQGGGLYLGITPEGASEISPRQKIGYELTANVAVRTGLAEEFSGAAIKSTGSLSVQGSMAAESVKAGGFQQSGSATVNIDAAHDASVKASTVRVKKGISVWKKNGVNPPGNAGGGDLFVFWRSMNQRSPCATLIYPHGTAISDPRSDSATPDLRSFGGLD